MHVTVTDAVGNPLPNAAGGRPHAGTRVQLWVGGAGSPTARQQSGLRRPTSKRCRSCSTWRRWRTTSSGRRGTASGAATSRSKGRRTRSTGFNSQGIDVRGHNLIWPGYDNLPQTMKNVLSGVPLDAAEQQQMRNLIASHIADEAGRFAGQLAAWDVINETRANHDVMDNLSEGNLAMVDWFQQARAADSHAKLYLNDYGILTSGGATNTANQQTVLRHARISHRPRSTDRRRRFSGTLFARLAHRSRAAVDDFRPLRRAGPRHADHGIRPRARATKQLQAMYTRDLMTAVFAQEGFDAFVMWGFWEGAHWRPDAAMFRNDWSIKPNGEAYLDLVFDQWWTDEDDGGGRSGRSAGPRIQRRVRGVGSVRRVCRVGGSDAQRWRTRTADRAAVLARRLQPQ